MIELNASFDPTVTVNLVTSVSWKFERATIQLPRFIQPFSYFN